MTAPLAPALLDREVRIETPEHVAVGYDLADLGSRFTALLLDVLLLVGCMLVVWVGLPLFAEAIGIPPVLQSLGLALLILLSFAIVWGYFIYFEGLREGQTPGKRKLGIRVVHEGGYPLTVQGAVVRNLIRVIDLQPVISGLVGGLAMLLHPRTQRLGDMAAGSIVVRERPVALLPEEASSGRASGPPRLAEEEFTALAMYVSRREALGVELRTDFAKRLADRLRHHLPDERNRHTGDGFLQLLYGDEAARRAAHGRTGAAGNPQASGLVLRQRERWAEYNALLETARGKGLTRLSEDRVSRFALLYREIAADLARARTYGGSPELIYTLERQVGSGHNLFYRPVERSWRDLGRWVTGGFPALVRRLWRPITVASALFYVPALVTFAVVRADPPSAREIVPAVAIARAEEGAMKEAIGKGYVDVDPIGMPVLSTSLMTNNIQVSFMAFAGGIAGGLGTLLTLVFNGVLLGGVAALFANHGLSLHLWTFVLPHGIIELTAITIAGGGGLWLGSALLFPGRRTRRDALVVRGREAVSLLAGAAGLLIVAGLIEGFISPSALPRPVKLSFAAAFAVLLAAYLFTGGRNGTAGPVPPT